MIYKQFTASKRAHEPPPFDARIHPERAPAPLPRAGMPSAIFSKECPPFSTPTTATTAAFTFTELFAGIGSCGVALEAPSGKCVFCAELEESRRDVFTANLKVANDNLHGDIYEVTAICSLLDSLSTVFGHGRATNSLST